MTVPRRTPTPIKTESPEADRPEPSSLPHPIFNWLSITGLAITASSVSTIVFFTVIGLVVSQDSGYAALTVLPPLVFAVVGPVLVFIGYVREKRRHRRGQFSSFLEKKWVIDPFDFARRTGPPAISGVFALGTFGLLGTGAGSLAVVEYTESNAFCGQACHDVMGPEATTYAHSAHSRINCVECHVGSGGDSYVRAKIGGVRQLFAMTLGNIERPIRTPIRNRRLSREMCESCHSADRFVGYKALTHSYFPSGSEDDPVTLQMIVKVGGGGNGDLMPGGGIHYHMMTARKVEYIARDPQRQEIPWVRVTMQDGETKVYSNEDDPLSNAELDSLEIRVMECVDCHSRPAHQFTSPVRSVNDAIAANKIPSTLRRIKEASVRALDGGYTTTDAAMAAIGTQLVSFYEEEEPEILAKDAKRLGEVTRVLKKIYRSTIFPEMNANWRAHPENIGHRDSPGCFRCHNDEMVDEEGEAIFVDCTKCHAILAQGEKIIQTTDQFEAGRSFIHPEDWEPFDEFSLCTDCHTGGAELYD